MPTIVDSISDGWNMVSVPFLVDDFQKSSVYPTASSSAFTYDGSYQPRNPLKNGEGYWVKWNGSQPIGYAGAIIAQESVAVNAGWNMVGSISVPILVSSITSDPGGVHTSQFFGFDNGNGYLPSDTVVPGRAYWVNVDQACKLIFSSSPSAVPANRIRITPTSEQPPPPPSDAHPASHIPHQFALAQNYPNPFNPLTFIRYQLPVPGFVTLRVFDLLGREIVTLVNETQTAGYKSVSFDASALPSGMYYYRLVAGSFTHVKKMVLVK